MHWQPADSHCDDLFMSANLWSVNQGQNIAGKSLSEHAHEGTSLARQ